MKMFPISLTVLLLVHAHAHAADATAAGQGSDVYAASQARMARMLADALPPSGDAVRGTTACVGGMAAQYPCRDIDLLSAMPTNTIGGGSGNDLWGWTDPQTGNEYALMGRTNGTAFVDVSDPENPVYLANLPTQTSSTTWRDIKTYANHAFIVSEAGGHGMQVFDLTRLRSIANPPQTVSADTVYTEFTTAHNIVINEDSGYAYGVGTNNCSGGLHMVDISTPTSPQFAGCVSSDGYTHDAQCVNYSGPDTRYQDSEICLNANEDTLTIFDVTNKAAPQLLSRTGYAGAGYTHQGWLTEDQRYFLLDDELDELFNGNNTRTRIWDVSNLEAPVIIGVYDAATPAIDHNLYVHEDKVYQANYRAGLRVLDTADIASGNLTEVAYFDIFPSNDSASFNGAWSVYPYFASGTILVSGIEQGLFMLRLNATGGPTFELLPTMPGTAGESNTWTTVGGTPSAIHVILFGLTPGSGSIDLGPCTGLATGITNPRPITYGFADASGSASRSRDVPAGASGVTLRFQALDIANCALSNVTTTTFQ